MTMTSNRPTTHDQPPVPPAPPAPPAPAASARRPPRPAGRHDDVWSVVSTTSTMCFLLAGWISLAALALVFVWFTVRKLQGKPTFTLREGKSAQLPFGIPLGVGTLISNQRA